MPKKAKRSASLEIWKFGGASLADAAAVERATKLIRDHHGPLVVVVSAMAGVTDILLGGARAAAQGDARGGLTAADVFERKNRAVVVALLRGAARRRTLALVHSMSDEYRDLIRAIVALRDVPARASDTLVSRGERVATAIVAAALAASGRSAVAAEALDFVVTDAHHGNATPDVAATRLRARAALLPLLRRGRVPVVPGFIGRAPDGALTTLGRGGSDLTATLLARCLNARRVVLWKDVPGILTADPRLVSDARLIPQLHQREAAEVAYYGAKVLHPRALIPLEGRPTIVDVRSFYHPERLGTEISARRTLPKYPVKALATIKGQALVTVSGKGMLGVPGIAARAFGAVHASGLSVSTIFQASSESSIGFTLAEADSTRAVAALERAFKEERALGLIEEISAQGGLAVIAVVGNGMEGTPGIAARVFGALAAGSVNVVAIAQGSSELNISFVVAERDAAEATRRVHAAFQLSKIGGGRTVASQHTDVVLLGFGKVGRVLADQIAARSAAADVRVVGLMDRSGYVFDPAGLSRRRLLALAERKDQGELLAKLGGTRAEASEALASIAAHAVSRPVLVDVTADETDDLLLSALTRGFDLVLANKRPLAGSLASWERLFETAQAHRRRVRYEATVGAGLPIIDTFVKLVESGDRVLSVEGCVSGTLGHVLSAVSSGQPFSEALREAMTQGYSEPDPREDLSGRDVVRKGMILARLMGYRGAVPMPEDLTPRSLRKAGLKEFLARVSRVDAEWRRRVERASAAGRVLRYVVTATPRSVSARLVAVPASSPFALLKGTRNLIAFTTRRYRNEPLVVMGPGAGPEVTAAGVLNDIQDLATR
jgi:aspartokinase/homoserine dehydrogenase 1